MSDRWNEALETAARCAESEAARIMQDVSDTAQKDTPSNASVDGGSLSRLRMSLAARAGTASEIAAAIRKLKTSACQ